VYLTAIVPKLGQSNVEAMGGEKGVLPMEATVGVLLSSQSCDREAGRRGPQSMLITGQEGYLHIDATMMAGAVCNDLSWDVGYEHCLNLAHHSAAAFLEEVTQVAYKNIPVSYIFCENDLVVTPQQQEGFINVIAEVTGKEVDVVKLPYGHCPNWSAPEKVAEIVEQLAMK
jgi:pimeloyl-ACP methyl ester carboxylesterase